MVDYQLVTCSGRVGELKSPVVQDMSPYHDSRPSSWSDFHLSVIPTSTIIKNTFVTFITSQDKPDLHPVGMAW
ncbi:hypothetical protein CDV31_004120 [Fusarium ambrosium]|uniref:Uncharacterized protein n=1 Tax=Fusarium ambrosium TaxID=131363 RepID=A0A428US15_9HYPO|nr:hypothetical protein CDV31_004120 [Fusarium ambrosium]